MNYEIPFKNFASTKRQSKNRHLRQSIPSASIQDHTYTLLMILNSLNNKIIKRDISYLLLFIIFSIIVFFPSLFGDPFWDDWVFIFKKSTDVMGASSPLAFFPGGSAAKSWPVFYATIWVMLKFFKEHYFCYHLFSSSLHGINGFLCWRILERVKVKNSLLLAMLYIVHPLQLFTVAWIIQIKTILSLFFFLSSLIFLINYSEKNKTASLVWSLVFFALSILTKSTTVAFSACLVFAFPILRQKIDLKKFTAYFAPPLILISLLSIVRTLWNFNIKEYLSNEVANTIYKDVTIVDRTIITAKLFLRYIIFTVFPYGGDLLFQQRTNIDYSPLEFLWIVASLILIYYLFVYLVNQKLYKEFFGLIFFCVTLVPFCGFVFIPIFSTTNFVPYWLSIPFIGLLPLISHAIKSQKVLIAIVATLTMVTHIQVYGFIQTEEIFLNSINASPETKVYQRSLVEHYIFTHQCKSAHEVYKKYFEKTLPPIEILEEKLKKCQ